MDNFKEVDEDGAEEKPVETGGVGVIEHPSVTVNASLTLPKCAVFT